MDQETWSFITTLITGGGGAGIILFLKWLYERFVAKNRRNWSDANDIRNELKESRDYWRDEAKSRQMLIEQLQKQISTQEEWILELKTQNAELKSLNNSLETEIQEIRRQNKILLETRDSALMELKRLRKKHGEL